MALQETLKHTTIRTIVKKKHTCSNTVEPRLSVPRLSTFLDYLDLISSPNFVMNIY